MAYANLYIILACLFGLLMTWGVGANDLANIMSTTMGSKAVSVRQAIIIAVVFEIIGAMIGGNNVTQTLRDGIINTSQIAGNPTILADGMLAVLAAGMTWMALASYVGLPVSITNAIVGSVVGFGLVVVGPHAIHWQQVIYIAISWISSPVMACLFSYFLMNTIQRLILARRDPLKQAKRYLPIYLFLTGNMLAFITISKGLKHFDIALSTFQNNCLIVGSGVIVSILGMQLIKRIPEPEFGSRKAGFDYIERCFALLMGLTACIMVFAHGANDVSVAVGPMTVVISLAQHAGKLIAVEKSFPVWITVLGVTGVLVGFLSYGRKVITTVGSEITALTPSRAFAATIAAAFAVVVSTSTGIPVSTTQTLVGAVLGIGLARGVGALNIVVMRNIFMSWIITLPAASILTIMFYHLFYYLFK